LKNLSVERLKEALRSEYPPGTVTLRTYDARALLALLGEGADPGPEDDLPDDYEVG
jgi:hypothetical protein